jgi:hypothetical protein
MLEARVTAGGNVPIVRGRGIPYTALIGVDGVLRWAGSPSGGTKELDGLIDAELKKVAQGWGATPEAKKARAQLYGKRNLTEARKLIEAMADDDGEKATLQQELAAAFAWRANAVQHLRAEGRLADAKEMAQALKKAVAGSTEWEQQTAPLLAAFDAPEDQKELALAKKIDGVLAGLRGKKVKLADAVKPMRAIAKTGAGTKAGDRAELLAAAFERGAKGK